MMVLFTSVLDNTGGHLILLNLNALQYNLASPNPTSLSVTISVDHHPDPPLVTSPIPNLYPALAGALNDTPNCQN